MDALEYKSHHRETKHLGTGGSSTGGSGGITAGAAAATGSTSAGTGGTLSNTNASAWPTSSGGLSGAEEDVGTLTGTLTGGKFTFKVITPKKTLLLCAPSEEEEVKWIGAIRVLIARRTTAEAGSAAGGHVQVPSASGSGSGSGGSEVNKKKEGREREKEREKETAGASGTRKRSISATGLAAAVLGGGDKEK